MQIRIFLTFTLMVKLDDIVVTPGEVWCSYVIRVAIVIDLPMRSRRHRPEGAKQFDLEKNTTRDQKCFYKICRVIIAPGKRGFTDARPMGSDWLGIWVKHFWKITYFWPSLIRFFLVRNWIFLVRNWIFLVRNWISLTIKWVWHIRVDSDAVFRVCEFNSVIIAPAL